MEALGSPPNIGAFSKLESHKRTAQRVRKAVSGIANAPGSLASIKTESILSANGRPFVVFDSGREDPERIILFGDRSHIQKLKDHPHWAADGTFKSAPKLFLQILTVHFFYSCTFKGKVLNKAIPAVFAILPNKYQRTYRRVWEAIRELLNDPLFTPTSFIADFEKAIRKSYLAVFPGSNVAGCLFHLMQCIMKRVKRLKMGSEFNRSENIRKFVKFLGALAFVPVANVETAFGEIRQLLGDSGLLDETPSMRSLYFYFQKNFIGSRDEFGVQTQPRYQPAQWNQFDRVRNRLPRSDAPLEGFHFGIQASLGVHPQFYSFAEKLKVKCFCISNMFNKLFL